jgi:hypothetical protein
MNPSEKQEGEPLRWAVIPGSQVRVSEEAAAVGVPRPTPGGAPHIELIRDGEVIRAINVTCSCGQRLRLLCTYPGEVVPPPGGGA